MSVGGEAGLGQSLLMRRVRSGGATLVSEMIAQRRAQPEPAAFHAEPRQKAGADLDVIAAVAERYFDDAHAPRIRFEAAVSRG